VRDPALVAFFPAETFFCGARFPVLADFLLEVDFFLLAADFLPGPDFFLLTADFFPEAPFFLLAADFLRVADDFFGGDFFFKAAFFLVPDVFLAAGFFPATFLLPAFDFDFDAFFASGRFRALVLLLLVFFLLAFRLEATVFFRPAVLRATAFLAAIYDSCQSSKRRELYIDDHHMEAPNDLFLQAIRCYGFEFNAKSGPVTVLPLAAGRILS